jgi:hypothetical protein
MRRPLAYSFVAVWQIPIMHPRCWLHSAKGHMSPLPYKIPSEFAPREFSGTTRPDYQSRCANRANQRGVQGRAEGRAVRPQPSGGPCACAADPPAFVVSGAQAGAIPDMGE